MVTDKDILAAGLQLKRVLCSRLLGEISDEQFDCQRSILLERYRLLSQSRACRASDDVGEGLFSAWH